MDAERGRCGGRRARRGRGVWVMVPWLDVDWVGCVCEREEVGLRQCS